MSTPSTSTVSCQLRSLSLGNQKSYWFHLFLETLLMEEILHQLRLVVYPVIYKVLYIPGVEGFLPSTVSCSIHIYMDPILVSWNLKHRPNLPPKRSNANIPIFGSKHFLLVIFWGVPQIFTHPHNCFTISLPAPPTNKHRKSPTEKSPDFLEFVGQPCWWSSPMLANSRAWRTSFPPRMRHWAWSFILNNLKLHAEVFPQNMGNFMKFPGFLISAKLAWQRANILSKKCIFNWSMS